MNNYHRPSELYEWTLNNLHTLPEQAQDNIMKNLNQLRWIKEMVEKLSPYQRDIFKLTLIKQIEDDSTPFCLMSITCIIYNLRKHGVDVSNLENLINTSEKVRAKIEATMITIMNNRIIKN